MLLGCQTQEKQKNWWIFNLPAEVDGGPFKTDSLPIWPWGPQGPGSPRANGSLRANGSPRANGFPRASDSPRAHPGKPWAPPMGSRGYPLGPHEISLHFNLVVFGIRQILWNRRILNRLSVINVFIFHSRDLFSDVKFRYFFLHVLDI